MSNEKSAERASNKAWRRWFERLGDKASAEIVDATKNLVTDERLAVLISRGILPAPAKTFGGRLGSSKIDNPEQGVKQLKAENDQLRAAIDDLQVHIEERDSLLSAEPAPASPAAPIRCVYCDHYGNVVNGRCQEIGTVVVQGGEAAMKCDCECVFPAPAALRDEAVSVNVDVDEQGEIVFGPTTPPSTLAKAAAKEIIEMFAENNVVTGTQVATIIERCLAGEE